MFKGTGLSTLVAVLILVSVLIIFLEWHAVRNITKGLGHGDGLNLGPISLRGGARVHGARNARNASGLAAEGATAKDQSLQPFPTPAEVRHASCVGRKYDLAALPRLAIIIPYLNETWEQMSATVGSMLAYTPLENLDEILFVDDANSPEWAHHDDLTALHPKVRVHRNEERQGLIRSKVIGASLVTSEVIVFMEPHCVVGRQWIEPLLERLSQSHELVVMPGIDIIPESDFSQYKQANHHIGGFDWSLTFNWMVLAEDRNKSYKYPEPYPTPALSGGIFGVWRDYWETMGTYDTNMTEWGGEHIEMSLRTWRCNGRVEIVPCSRLGHVFRERNPYTVHPALVIRNLKRAALVWLDDRLEDFYKAVPAARTMDAGDVEERRRLKESLQCKNMSWYIENVYPELLTKQPRRR